MCGRFLLTSPLESLRRVFAVEGQANIPPRYNIAPMQPVLIVRQATEDGGTQTKPGERELVAVQWGLVPPWMKERPTSNPMINARSETVAQKPSFRSAYRRRRCLVPANGWYEWVTGSDGAKQPWLMTLDEEGEGLFAFAGLWEVWTGTGGEAWLETMTVLTRPASGPLSRVHHRMPVVLAPKSFDRWLTPRDPAPQDALADLDLVAPDRFDLRPVSRRVNSVRNDDADLLEPPSGTQGSLF